MELQGQVALITGASAPHGIGRAIAVKLAALGAHVVLSDLPGADRDAGLKDAVEAIVQNRGHASALSLDVTSEISISQAVAQIMQAHGRLDILVNNAGSLAGSDAFESTTPAQWQISFEVNLLGPMMLTQAVLPYMKALGGGRIINVGSTGSLGAEPGFGAYTAMKHGLVGLSKTIAAEFGPDGIRCNTICPGYISTDMHMAANARLAAEAGRPVEEIKASRYSAVALRDAGLPEDVAEAAAYLAGPRGRYVTGINLPVTGGVPFGI